jgi:SAM-dependent methyltransferase
MSWSERGLTFGSVAADYERFRPDYPAEVVDVVRRYARRPVRTAVEIGAGTGKATRTFTAAGIAVTAVEPDPEMLAQLRSHVGGEVTPVHGSLEDAGVTGPVDLVFAAAALHWTVPETRWSRIAALLPPGGVVASFGGPVDLADEDLSAAVRRAGEPEVVDVEFPSPDGTPDDAPLLWPGTEMRDSPLFTDVEQHVVERRATLTADHAVGHLSTVSAYLLLPAAERADVLARIRKVLPDRVDVVADLTVHLARRR